MAEGDVYRDLATCPKGLATFGTPHRGSMYGNLLKIIPDLFKTLEEFHLIMGEPAAPPKGYVDILKKGNDASYIIGLQFLDRYRSAIPITSFYERKGVLGSHLKIVNKKSATLKDNCQESNHRERRVGLNADHDGMVKFSRAKGGLGRAVLSEIKSLANEVLKAGSSSGWAYESTDTDTDVEFSETSESTTASWEEGSVTYSGDDGIDREMLDDQSIDSNDDDDVDTGMLENESIDESNFGLTSYPRPSYSGPKARQGDPELFCYSCPYSETRQCPLHCKYCQKKRRFRSPDFSYPSNYKDRQSFNLLLNFRDEAELCQQHKKQWSKIRVQPGSQGFILFK